MFLLVMFLSFLAAQVASKKDIDSDNYLENVLVDHAEDIDNIDVIDKTIEIFVVNESNPVDNDSTQNGNISENEEIKVFKVSESLNNETVTERGWKRLKRFFVLD